MAITCSVVSSGGRFSSANCCANFKASSPRKPKRPGFSDGPFRTALRSRPSASSDANAVSAMFVMFVFQIVAKPIGQFVEGAFQFFPGARLRYDLIQRRIHAGEPSVALGGADGKPDVPLADPRMTTLL